jgi:glyoxylase-like metal-dependent hydrolase (beta-lactamase superfamily II)
VRALALHPDVLVVTSALLQVNCVIVRGRFGEETRVADETGFEEEPGVLEVIEPGGERPSAGETFVIDSPVLPDELDALPALLEQARFPSPSGLLVTHGDWDHLLGRLAFPGVALGCAESTAERLRAAPGEAQRELRAFDEHLMIERARPLALGSVQALSVPGRCGVGQYELELHPAEGHTADGMVVVIPWTGVVVVGDYISPLELPTVSNGGDLDTYLTTLERMRGLVASAEHIVPGHGPVLSGDRALAVLEEDCGYLRALRQGGLEVELPSGRRTVAHRHAHLQNTARVRGGSV